MAPMDARLRLLAEVAGVCEIRSLSEVAEMSSALIPWFGATSPTWFKAVFLILIALAIPGFFVLMWLMSRSQKHKKKAPSEKENV
jgi:hypothetical protein